MNTERIVSQRTLLVIHEIFEPTNVKLVIRIKEILEVRIHCLLLYVRNLKMKREYRHVIVKLFEEINFRRIHIDDNCGEEFAGHRKDVFLIRVIHILEQFTVSVPTLEVRGFVREQVCEPFRRHFFHFLFLPTLPTLVSRLFFL
jgi:hypothetical protein